MAWKKKLWGVFFAGSIPGDKPVLLSTGWMNPRPQSQYDGEPTRAILFMTREQAREWCRKKKQRTLDVVSTVSNGSSRRFE